MPGRPAARRWAGIRHATTLVRKRRRALGRAEKDPYSHPGTVKKLREKAAVPSHDLLRYLAENKIGKVVTQADRRALWYDLTYRRYAPTFLSQVKPRMRFWTAALEKEQLPLPRLPEVAIAGRSNSGKSTLVNYLCGRHSALVKREPGSTRELVFWQIGRPAQLCLVDLPGYGYAHAPQETRLQWTEFTLWYVRARANLKRVLLLINAQAGIKPTDREMIAYLERHAVKWQILVTKSDRVKNKELARRITIMEEDTKDYQHMSDPPLPISSLKRQGMQRLRDMLGKLSAPKDVVKEGIRRRVYDLMELKRAQRSEKARKRREKKRAEAEEQRDLESVRAEAESAEDENMADADLGAGSSDGLPRGWTEVRGDGALHAALDDHADPPPRQKRSSEEPSSEAIGEEEADAKQPIVAHAHYSLEDRDSLRVASLMRELLPDRRELRPELDPLRCDAAPMTSHNSSHTFAAAASSPGSGRPGTVFAPTAESEVVDDFSMLGLSAEVDSDDSDDEFGPTTRPNVLHFNPAPRHASSLPEQPPSSSSPFFFPSLPDAQDVFGTSSTAAAAQVPRRDQVRLVQGGTWGGSTSGDRVYDADDFASEADRASGFRRSAPPAPAPGSSGQLVTEARRRFEREWAMELDDVAEGERTSASRTKKVRSAETDGREMGAVRFTTRPLITRDGGKPIPKGVGKWRVLGRPPAKILKRLRTTDVARIFGKKDRVRRKRNFGSGLEWHEAKDHWLKWYRRNRKNMDRVLEADSPAKADVEARHEAWAERRRAYSRRGRPVLERPHGGNEIPVDGPAGRH